MADCPEAEATGIDLAAYLVEPERDEYASFRAHFPGCARCSARLASLTRLEEALRAAGGTRGPARAHPAPETLLAFQRGGGLDAASRGVLQAHLAACRPCRDELSALAGFDLGALARQPAAASPAPGWRERLAAWIAALAPPRPQAAAAALVALALLVGGAAAWWSLGGTQGEAPSLARAPRSPATPSAAEPAPGPGFPPATSEARATPSEAEAQAQAQDRWQQAAPSPSPAPSGPTGASERLAAAESPEAHAESPAAAAQPERGERAGAVEIAARSQAPRTPEAPGAETGGLPPIEALWAEAGRAAPAEVRMAQAALGAPRYAPPQAAAGPGRVHDVLRAADPRAPDLRALAPDHPGLTLRASPTLYWTASGPAPRPVTFTLVDPEASRPALEIALEAPAGGGIRAVPLARYGVALAPGTVYQWFVALPEPGDGGFAVVAGGSIVRVLAGAEIAAELEALPPAHRAHHLAGAGYFYDALELFTRWDARESRGALLAQAGLAPPARPGEDGPGDAQN